MPHTPSHGTDAPILDRSVVVGLFGDDPSALATVVDCFRDDSQSMLGQLEEALEAGAISDMQAVAHTLKGAMGTIGAAQAAQIARELEGCGSTADLPAAGEILAALRVSIDGAQRALEETLPA